jgi:small subunit ribosomal protein S21
VILYDCRSSKREKPWDAFSPCGTRKPPGNVCVLPDLYNSLGRAVPCGMGGSLICGEPFTYPLLKDWKSISQGFRDAFFVAPKIIIEVVEQRDGDMKVIVQDNQIEKAIRDLKKKLTKEGFFSEIKERRFYDKPSVQRKKKQAKAAKRRRKRMRKMY